MVSHNQYYRLWAEEAAGRGGLRVRRPEAPSAAAADSLALIAGEVRDCTRCGLCRSRTKPVAGEGPPTCELMFVGEAPGYYEDQQGRPFIGPAGHLLTRMIEAMGLKREHVFITNVLKCRPPSNRDPLPEEIAACKQFLKRQLQLLEPRVVIPLGAHAARWLLGVDTGISQVRGRIVDRGAFLVVPTFHPSYLLRSPEEKGKDWADLQVAMKILGLPVQR